VQGLWCIQTLCVRTEDGLFPFLCIPGRDPLSTRLPTFAHMHTALYHCFVIAVCVLLALHCANCSGAMIGIDFYVLNLDI
jgi:hypothetical protein